MSNQAGTLYVVATPIGNREDLSVRARRILSEAHIVAAEDTRHSRKLLDHYGIARQVRAYHEFNERGAAEELVNSLAQGQDVAIVTDAGTPLISDPGFRIVQRARESGIRVSPIPGPCAAIAALSVAGLPTDRFAFEGFLPSRRAQRRRRLRGLARESRTLVFYESPQRVLEFIADCVAEFGEQRDAVVARELTKIYETVRRDTLGRLAQWLEAHPEQQAGEFVVLVAGLDDENVASAEPGPPPEQVLAVLLRHLPLRQAVLAAVEITGRRKTELYRMALRMQDADGS